MTSVVESDAQPTEGTNRITAADMQAKLHDLDWLYDELAQSEPIEQVPFGMGGGANVRFQVQPDWASGAEEAKGTDPVNAFVSIGAEGAGREFRLTKDALLEATSICGLPKKYTERCPSEFIEAQLNYWFRSGLGDRKEYQALVVGTDHIASAVAKGTVTPFSNVRLVEHAVAAVREKYGEAGVESLKVDYKFQHSLRRTKFSLIIPEKTRVIERTGTDNDTWSAGLNVSNSLIGLEQTQFNGYLFRWWCTNGCIDTLANSGTWSRKSGQGDEVYEWAKTTVDDILGGLEHSFDAVQGLVDVPVDGSVADTLRDIFAEYKVPNNERERVIANMLEADNLTMYAVQQAITQTANRNDIDPGHMVSLMQIGGDLPHNQHERCNLGKVHRHD